MSSLKLLFIVNDLPFLFSHRWPLVLAAQAVGYEVAVATAPCGDEALLQKLQAARIPFYPFPLARRHATPKSEWQTLMALRGVLQTFRPDVVFAVTIKVVIYAGILSRLLRISGFVAAISGLGTVFLQSGFKASLVRKLAEWAYSLSLQHSNSRVIFQNPDDRGTFCSFIPGLENRSHLIKGSGVNLQDFRPHTSVGGPVVVGLCARLIREKGIYEFVEASKILQSQQVPVRMILIGAPFLENPSSIQPAELAEWVGTGWIESWGHRSDIPEVLEQLDIACLPSYREGVPKSLLEAAAAGLPIITTDVPGCRDVVVEGFNGLLVPARDPLALAAAIQKLVDQPVLRAEMGRQGRIKAEAEFSIEGVVAGFLIVLEELKEMI